MNSHHLLLEDSASSETRPEYWIDLGDRGVKHRRRIVQPQTGTKYPLGSAAYYNALQPQAATVRLPPELPDDSSWTMVGELAHPIEHLDSPAVGASDNERGYGFLGVLTPDPTAAHLDRLFSVAHDEQFEAGVESRFSTGLQQLFQADPLKVLDCLRLRLTESRASPEVLSEMLEWASRREARSLREAIVHLLCLGLCHRSSLVRDAAALGLAYLEGSAAIGPLRQAIEREQVPELREDLLDLVRSLESEESWQSSSGS